MFDRQTWYNLLFDFYGNLLTDKQQQIIKYYYFYDLSLGEIAEEFQITRQAVHDNIRRSQASLEEYENKLGFISKYIKDKELLEEIIKGLKELRPVLPADSSVGKVDQILSKLTDILNLD